MSQEAEYFLRDISRHQVRQIARRISRQDRRASEQRMQAWWQQEASSLENRMQGELSGLRDEVVRRQQRLQAQIDCNRQVSEILKQQSDLHGDVLVDQQKALQVLAEHDQQLEAEIRETNQLQIKLAEQLTLAEKKIEDEINHRKAERLKQARSVSAQRQLAEDGINRLDNQRIEAVGLTTELHSLRLSLDRAIRTALTASEEQAALALLLQVQNETDSLTLQTAHRESEFGRCRESARLSLELARQRLSEFSEDREILKVFALPINAINHQHNEVTSRLIELNNMTSGDFGSRLARWEHGATEAASVLEQVDMLWRDRDRILDQIQNRNRLLEGIMEALIEVWGERFEIDYIYSVTDDPRSTLMLQTKRPNGRNVTVHIDLDGRMQISFTGYLGMECTKDVAEFRTHLEKAGDLQVQQIALHDQPDEPNPPDVDGKGGDGLLVYRPPSKSTRSSKNKGV
jgi:hypothetical protein